MISTTGNTLVEAVAASLPDESAQDRILQQIGLGLEPFVLATFHRPENTDDIDALAMILREAAALPVPVVLPLHPRTQQRITTAGLAELTSHLRVTGPLDYSELLTLIRHSAIVITDSGGIQEEITVLKRPTLVIRRSNERPEIEEDFGTRTSPNTAISKIITTWLSEIKVLHGRLAGIPSPYGDGTASEQIVRALEALSNPR